MLQAGFADCWATTAGPRWVKLGRAAVDHRRFRDAMDRLGEVQLRAIVNTPVPVEDPASQVFRADHLRLALEAAVRGGHDTDTVAAISGGLLGAAYGASALPSHWRLALRGWAYITARGVVHLATQIVR